VLQSWKETMLRLLKMLRVSHHISFFNSTVHVGQRTTPSTVAFTDDAQRLVGIPAKR